MLDRAALAQAVDAHGTVVRVVICAHHGSSPREAGAAMLVWAGGQSGTIGGGALEFEAAAEARQLLTADNHCQARKVALGPALGQCCGGAVVLGFERFDAPAVAALPDTGLHIRRLSGTAEMPLALRRLQSQARGQGVTGTRWVEGWLAEPIAAPQRKLWLWGAGHVGRAIAATMAPLPGLSLTWIDTDRARFPDAIPAGVSPLVAANPADLIARAPQDAEHLILTFSHALDLELCHRLLGRGFAACGLIGSASKAARFRSRLAALGHRPESIARIRCPIGDPGLGKHPQAIAISVAAAFLQQHQSTAAQRTAV